MLYLNIATKCTKMKIKLVENMYFIAPGPRPEPQSCQMVLSALSLPNWSLSKGTMAFFADTLGKGRMKQGRLVRAGVASEAQDEWQDGESAGLLSASVF